jgi:Ca2+-binding EF-hand superfamily protein
MFSSMSLAGGSRALRQAFTSVDLDGNGQLDYYELCEALKVGLACMIELVIMYFKSAHNCIMQAFNIVVTQEECRELFISLGANEKGYIVYNDFRKAVEEASAAW